MSHSEEAAGFWLPSEFFTDEDFLIDKEKLKKNTTTVGSSTGFCFPTESPYYLEAENHENLKDFWVMSTLPQSTQAHHGSWSSRSFHGSSNGSPQGAPSPPTTPLRDENDAVKQLIYRAADRIVSLKLSGADNFGPGPTEHKIPSPSFLQKSQIQRQYVAWRQNQGSGMYQRRSGRQLGEMGQAAWTHQNPTRSVFGSGVGGAVKRKCAGTGVFLPRIYGNINNESNAHASDSLKKPGCSFGLVPISTANRVFTEKYDNLTGVVAQSQPVSHPLFNKGFVQDYESSLLARRSAIMSRNLLFAERSLIMGRDTYLPQEWTY